MYKKTNNRSGVTLLIVLAMMVMFAMLVATFMVIVSHNRRTAEFYARIRVEGTSGIPASGTAFMGAAVRHQDDLDDAFQILMVGSLRPDGLDNIVGPHSILENLYGHSPTGDGIPFSGPFSGTPTALFTQDASGKPYALRPNILAPKDDGVQEYKGHLENNDIRMNPDYTAPDFMTMFLAWNDVKDDMPERIIPSFHRPQLVKYWRDRDTSPGNPLPDLTELRKYVLRPLPIDHPDFTGSNPAASTANLQRFLTNGPWDVDNDGNGTADGIWLDLGLSARRDATGKWYKPLVSILVIDMEGRININTLDNLVKTSSSPSGPSGMGLGAAELSSALVPEDILTERYGGDEQPGGAGADELYLLRHHGINFAAYHQGGVRADWFGTTLIDFDYLGNRLLPQALPPAQLIPAIPYLMNPYTNNDGDNPFTTEDLESLARSVIDGDYHRLPRRLRGLLGGGFDPTTFDTPQRRYNLATRGSDIPVARPLYEHIQHHFGGDAHAVWMLLPEEIRQGEKVNLNRLTLSPNWNIHWNENAAPAEKNLLLLEKSRFAQEIFYLLRVLFPAKTGEDLERLAQWSVNLVDFIDPDDVMTPFIFKTDGTPFDNAGLTNALLAGTLTAGDLSGVGCTLIWGFEKPEVVITETLAFHNRAVTLEDNEVSPGVFGPPIPVQKDRPQGSLFVKLYRQGNDQRSYSASSLVNPVTNTLDLSKRTANDDYVWRLAVGKATKTAAGQFAWDDGDNSKNALYQLLTPDSNVGKHPQFYQWSSGDFDGHYRPDLGFPERFIWFGNDFPEHASMDADAMQQRSFINVEGDVLLPFDTSLVVAPWKNDTPPPMAGVSVKLPANTMIAAHKTEPSILLNASEPLDAYQGRSFDTPPWDDGNNDTIHSQRGTLPCYKTICLQRLADPHRPHHPIGNPYITVDWSMIDLHVFNSEDNNEDDPNKERLPHSESPRFSSRQWTHETASGFFNIWDRTLDDLADSEAGLSSAGTAGTPNHTLNALNGAGFSKPVLHFPWNDAPLMNTGELMLVPTTTPGRFGVEFHDHGQDEPFFGDTSKPPRYSYHNGNFTFPLYLDWGGDSDLLSLFDCVRVPSRFAGTIQDWTNDSIPRPIYTMREPGKFNLNTITKEGWETLRNGRSGFPSYEQFRIYRQWSGTLGNPDFPSEYRPLRSPAATQWVPPLDSSDTLAGEPVSATLFDWELIDDGASNPYTVLENLMRLSDVTTTRSNVFAIWITVGYFEVEPFDDLNELEAENPTLRNQLSHITDQAMFKAVYPDGCILGKELGLDTGTVRRYRTFYLIDRSVPVGDFRRGDAPDFKDVIIKRTPLE